MTAMQRAAPIHFTIKKKIKDEEEKKGTYSLSWRQHVGPDYKSYFLKCQGRTESN